jgi:hypothetical protein
MEHRKIDPRALPNRYPSEQVEELKWSVGFGAIEVHRSASPKREQESDPRYDDR